MRKDIIKERQKKIKHLKEEGIDPYPVQSQRTNRIAFYGESWRRKGSSLNFTFKKKPLYFDVMIDDRYLYLIEMPSYDSDSVGLFFPFGALIGMAVDSENFRKRQEFRSTWIDNKEDIISNDYEKYLLLKIPLKDLTRHIFLNKRAVTLFGDDKKITLERYKREFDIFRSIVERYI